MPNTKSKREQQLELEQESVEIGVKRYRDRKRDREESELPPGLALMNKAIEPLKERLEEFKKPSRGGQRVRATRELVREVDDDYEVAYIIAKTCINHITDPVQIQNLAVRLSNRIINHIEYKKFKDENPSYLKAVEENLNSRTAHKEHRKKAIMHAKRNILDIEDTDWSIIDRAYSGSKLVELFIESTGLAERKRMQDSSWMLDGTDKTKKWIEEQHAQCELLEPEFLPMIVEPKDWTGPYDGGFLSSESNLKVKILKTRNREALDMLEKHKDKLQHVYDALNNLQKTAWRINEDVFQVVDEAWENDNGLGGLPTDREEPLPPKPWGIMTDDEFEEYKENNPEKVKNWKAKARDVYYRRTKNKSKRYQIAKKLWIARKFKDYDEFYFVWVMDWRGRVYPLQNHINPQNDDVARGLLEFSEGKRLGKSGARWLKIHIANTFGEDKISFSERVEWVEDHHDKLLEVADDPYHNRFWEEADDPYQFLAGCFEYAGYVEEGEDFVSHLPINMDGSCNGLQNFSAILKDPTGAQAVNLKPSEEPQDVYQEVADKVEERLENSNSKYASVWKGKVTRDITKRPVMTTPYGVTTRGMRDQLIEKLRDLDENGSYLGVNVDNFKACRFLANQIEKAIEGVLAGASEAMDWLQEAVDVANDAEIPVKWTTPVGMIPYQFYVKQNTKRIATYWGEAKVRVRLSVNVDKEGLNTRKQKSGIAPNFVHSYDSAHLMKVINKAKQENINDFCMVHDSFGTHAQDMDRFTEIIRETFVDMYQNNDPLMDFYEELLEQLPEEYHSEVPKPPKRKDFNLDQVKQSNYFFA